MPPSEPRPPIARDAALWGGGGVLVAIVLELLARWALPDYVDDLAGWAISGVMLVWLGMVVGISMERRNQWRRRIARDATQPDPDHTPDGANP